MSDVQNVAKPVGWFVALIVLGCVILGLGGALFVRQSSTQDQVKRSELSAEQAAVKCIEDWANAQITRNRALTQDSLQRQNAIDAIFRLVAEPTATKAQFQADLATYNAAAAKFKADEQQHPQPTSVQFNCLASAPSRP